MRTRTHSIAYPDAKVMSNFILAFTNFVYSAKVALRYFSQMDSENQQFRFPDLPAHRGDHDFNLFVPPGYLLGPIIGDGEFATVRLSYNLRNGESVAIKCFSPRSGEYRMLDEQIVREVAGMKGLIHDHLVRLHEVIIRGNRIFLVMEHCQYGDLRNFINNQGVLSEDQAREFFGHLILGVRKMHSVNLVHRDLKLENLLIDGKLRLKIADFGCARRQMDKRLNTITGSYAYGAPELFRGDYYDGRKTDAWSMGVILYAMLVGRLPFKDRGQLRQLLRERMQLPQLSEDLSPECVDVLRRLLSYDPAERISVEEVMSHPWMMHRDLRQEE